MAFNMIRQTEDGVPVYECLSTDTKKAPQPLGAKVYETNTGNEYEYLGSTPGWVKVRSKGGAVQAADFTPSSYTANLTMDADGESFAIATGATKVQFGNLGVASEAIRVAFGTSAANAISNLNIAAGAATTGYYIPSVADAGAGAFHILGVPSGMTHGAAGPAVAADTQTVTITQGT